MKKIMFNDRFGLTDAVLEGRKTVTRRIVSIKDCSLYHKNHFGSPWKDEPMCLIINDNAVYCELCGNGVTPKNGYKGVPLPHKIGEIISIAQRYEDVICGARFHNDEIFELQKHVGYKNKMFVEAELMPHQIEILDVRVERLQDITDEDCIKEGIVELTDKKKGYSYGVVLSEDEVLWLGFTPIEAFSFLIDKISGKGTWESNPYVFRYEFKLK